MKYILSTQEYPWQDASSFVDSIGDERRVNLSVTSHTDQIFEGWGGCFNELGWLALSRLSEKKQEQVLSDLFHPEKGCRFNFCRIPIGASDYAINWYSHNEYENDYEMHYFSIERDFQYLIPYIHSAQKYSPQLRFFASPWSPPTWLKYPSVYNYGRIKWDSKSLKAYALYFLKFVQAYQDNQIPIEQIHVQNEPVADQKFPSCVWSGEKLRDFIRDYLFPLFKEAGLSTQIWLGTLNTGDYDHFVYDVLSDPQAYNAISGIGLQWAGKHMIQRIRMAWPDKPLIQTENECGDGKNSWEYAMYVFQLLHHYITNGVIAYVYWNMVLPPGGESTWGWKQNSMITVDGENDRVIYNPEFYVMKHVSAYVCPGAVRVLLEGNNSANAIGFRNPDGGHVVIITNPLQKDRTVVLGLENNRFELRMPPYSLATWVER